MNFNGVIAVAENFLWNSAINQFDLFRIIEFLNPSRTQAMDNQTMEWYNIILLIIVHCKFIYILYNPHFSDQRS